MGQEYIQFHDPRLPAAGDCRVASGCAEAPRNDGVGFLEGQAKLAPQEIRLVIANTYSPEAISSNYRLLTDY